jgi:hypothetical protein
MLLTPRRHARIQNHAEYLAQDIANSYTTVICVLLWVTLLENC